MKVLFLCLLVLPGLVHAQFIGGNGRGDVQHTFSGLGQAQYQGGSGRGDVQITIVGLGTAQYQGGVGRGDALFSIAGLGSSQYLGGIGRGDALLSIAPPIANLITDIGGSNTLCFEDSLFVQYAASGTYALGNIFIVQLSDSTGSFDVPLDIGNALSTGSGTVVCNIPASVPSGSGYRIRMVSSEPLFIGPDNGVDLTLQALTIYFADVDGDGFGDAGSDSLTCLQPSGYVADSTDLCPNDPLKTAPGTCGCGVVDDPTDTDNDGIPDCVDSCPTVPGQVGSPCDDGDPDTNLSQLNAQCTCAAVPEIGDYRSAASGNWTTPGNWEVYTGTSFVPATLPPGQSDGWITIRSGHAISVTSSVTVDQVVVLAGGTLAVSSTLNLSDGPGDDLRVKGLLTTGTLNGPGSVAIRNGGVHSFTSSSFTISSVVNIEAGGTMNKGGTSQALQFAGVINNAGTFNMNGGWISGSQSGITTINNLPGGVINVNGWFSNTIGWLSVNFFNAGTFNKNAGSLVTFTMSGRIRNQVGGVVNVNAGTLLSSANGLTPDLTYQRGQFNVAAGATLHASSNFGFQFLGTEINNNGTLGPMRTYFVGGSAQVLSGTGMVTGGMEINNPAGVSLGGTQTVTSDVTLANGHLTLGNNDLILDGASLTGGSASSYLITNGTGCLRRTVPAGGSRFFPVGTATSFAPATLNLDGSGTTDAYRVRVNSGVSTTYDANDAPTGAPITSAALQHTWFVRDLVSGGTNATLLLQWNAPDEAPGFTRNACRIARNDGSSWDVVGDVPAGGAGPFSLQRSGITDLGPFTVLGGIIDLCPNGPEPGTPCDDGSVCTTNDVIGSDCQCLGTFVDTDGDGTCDAEDCAPTASSVHPGATEVCNGIDDDCDGQVDEGCGGCSPADIALMLTNPELSQSCFQNCYSSQYNNLVPCLANCYVQAGYSPTCATCVVEFQFCAAINCPECQTDPNSAACIACRQSAGCDAAFAACSGLQDADGDGDFAPFDCDDNNAAVSTFGVEGCVVDGLDNDCDGQVDEDALVDADNDGFTLCTGDCNDMNPDIHPGATEVCNGVDDDCDGIVDNGFPTYYLDNDGDGFGDPNVLGACGATGSVPNNLDCDDADPTVYNGAPELCDGLDNDCNGTVDDNLSEDLDNDGFSPCQGDCDDANSTIHPGAPELCDGLDNDCNGAIEPTRYLDADGDGYGAPGVTVPCGQPGVLNDDDCDDGDPLITLPPSWYPDADGDGYGVYGVPVVACTQPPGYAGNSFDCNDADPLVFPGQGCTECSAADLALMASNPLVTSPATPCLMTFGSAPDPQECFSDCISANGLSEPCADCFAAYAYCLTAACPICQEQPESPACIACQANSGCKEDFTACSGLEDADSDGYFAPFDCNDQNASVHPDAPELCDDVDNDCDGIVDEGCDVRIAVKVMLDGPYDSSTGLMQDGMRALGLLPTTEPYAGLDYVFVEGGGESTAPGVLANTGNDAIVDWVVLELRDSDDPTVILASRSALLQRDGDAVDVDGTSPVTMPIGAGTYHVAVRHRNHLGCMTANAVALAPAPFTLDFTAPTTATFGTNARKSVAGLVPAQVLWAGDVTFNGSVQYTGAGNDRDPILVTVGSTTPNNVVSNTYSTRDVNLNGNVQYTGAGNDRDPILVNVGSTTPNNVRTEQLP